MALTILSSNRVEVLQSRLAETLSLKPLRDPFAPELIVIPTFAMGRWLNLRFAQQRGIAVNFHYPQPGEWIWQLASSLLDDSPQLDPYSTEALCWHTFSLLPELLAQAAFDSLRSYLEDDHSGIKRWQLSQRIAQSFDRYQAYRPQMILDWCGGNDHQWQALLWRKIVATRGLRHRVDTIARLIERLQSDAALDILPERFSLFALSNLPPLYLDVIKVLAQRMELNLYLHSPTDQYWADLENEKRKSRLRLANPELDELYENGNELLASWGRQGQVFQDLLLGDESLASIDIDMFTEPDDRSLLVNIQQSIFEIDSSLQQIDADDSVTIHICHSAMRECQVLLDQLLAMLEQDPQLQTEDILVMIPDIATYAPYIEAVFQRERLSYNISDITLADQHPLVTTFLQLLKLPRSRFALSEIMALLDNNALRQRFELDNQALEEIRRLVTQAHTRWGIDAGHKAELELPNIAGNTWHQARQRFFAGFALADNSLWNGIAPLSEWSDNDAEAIGRFWHFFERLCSWRQRLAKSRRAAEWQSLLAQLLDDFFIETNPQESRLQQIRNAVNELQTGSETQISPELIAYLMERLLTTREHSGQLYSGGVTFCGMRPMRSIPFKVICLLGMNRNDFPRRDSHSDFELMSKQTCAGDPSKRVEDRYLMLETLLCARRRLYISYTGRSLKDNSQLQASVLVQELRDFIDGRFHSDPNNSKFSDGLVYEHPMQAFSARNFEPPNSSFSRYWAELANRLVNPNDSRQLTWPPQPLPGLKALPDAIPSETIELEQLRRFVKNPIQYFFQQRLGIYLAREDQFADDETFDLNTLEQWQLKQQLAADTLAQRDDGTTRLFAEGLLAHGHAATAQIERIKQDQAAWLENLQPYAGSESQAVPIDITMASNAKLSGSVDAYYPGMGLMAYQSGKLKGQHLLQLWIDHLAISAGRVWQAQESSLLVANNETWRIAALEPDTAIALLEDYCALYREGLQYPLPVFPDSSYAWACASNDDQALTRVNQIWQNQWSRNQGGDPNDAYIRLALRGCQESPIGSANFAHYAQRLYARVLDLGAKI